MPVTSLAETYQDLHRHPELAFHETRTAAIVAESLASLGYQVTTGVGRTGVVGVLPNGPGPTALLRADMDALPVLEQTGLPYASTATAVDAKGNNQPLMHACGHDVHVACLLGAAAALAGDRAGWSGTVMLVFQPAEEIGAGAEAMVADDMYGRLGAPDVVLGQHVAPLPAGLLGLRTGPAFASSDALRITLYGEGGHGSRPESTVDPVVMAAATVMRLQTVISREIAGTDTAVLTVGAIHAGTASNIIPSEAELLLTLRTYSTEVRRTMLDAITRIVRAEAAASGASREPAIEPTHSLPLLHNHVEACEQTRAALESAAAMVVDPGLVTGSEDVGVLADAAGVPCVYWLLGGADPADFAGLTTPEQIAGRVATLPSNHSPYFAPVIEPTLTTGVNALVAAAKAWLPVNH